MGPAMAKPERYRQYAEECLKWARKTEDDEECELFLNLAHACLMVASRKDGKPPISPSMLN
jgi:hypothetical protein